MQASDHDQQETLRAMEDQFIIRPAKAIDIDTLAAFNIAMALETETRTLDATTATAGVAAVLAEPARGEYFVAADSTGTIGALLVTREWSDWHCRDYWWIQSVYVRPAKRRCGVFSALYRHVATAAGAAGARSLRLYVEVLNTTAQTTYQRLGMSDSGYRVMEQVL